MVNDIPDFCGILEECKAILERCPKPEYDCIVMTEAAWSNLKWFCHLESGALTPNPIAGDLGKLDLYGLEVFATDTPETARRLAEKLRDEGRRPLLVAEGRPEDYGPSPVAESLEAWWNLNRAEFGPTMVPPCLRDTPLDRIRREAMELTGYPIKHVVTSQGTVTLTEEPEADTPVTVEGKS